MKSGFGLVVGFALCAAPAGCSSGGVPVDGKVVKGGAPYTLAEGESITITLKGDAGTTGTAAVEKDGSFAAKLTSGGPLPAGKYKVTLVHYLAPAAGAKGPPTPPAPKDGGETWDVSAANKSFTVDLAKYK